MHYLSARPAIAAPSSPVYTGTRTINVHSPQLAKLRSARSLLHCGSIMSSARPERCHNSWEAMLQGNTDHSVLEQGVGQANRDVRVNILWSCGYFTLLFPFSVLPSIPPATRLSPYRSLILQQMMQQQAALMAATQGSYLNPMAAIAAAQMQQMAAFNVNGLVATPMTPSSGTH